MALALPAKVVKLMDTFEAGQALAEIMEVLKHVRVILSAFYDWALTD